MLLSGRRLRLPFPVDEMMTNHVRPSFFFVCCSNFYCFFFYLVVLGFSLFERGSPGLIGFYLVLSGSTGFLSGLTWFWYESVFTGFCRFVT